MKPFDYWFNYIVRNGEYYRTFDNYSIWILIIGDCEYEAVRGGSYDKINVIGLDDEDAFYSSSFEPNALEDDTLLRELRKPIL